MNTDPKENNRTAVRVTRAPSKVIGMTAFESRIFVACEGGVYELVGDEFVPIRFLHVEPAMTLREAITTGTLARGSFPTV